MSKDSARVNTEGTQDPDRAAAISDYAAARQEWDDRFAGQRRTVRVLVAITFLALGLGGLGMGYGIHTGARSQYLPYVVQVDTLGRVATAPLPQQVREWPPHVIKRELDLFFERLRGVSPDLSVIGANHRAVDRFLPGGTPAARKLRDYFQDPRNNPVKRAQTETVAVEVVSVNAVSDRTWRVEWIETVHARASGQVLRTPRFVATTQIEFRRITSRQLIRDNPLGMFVLDLDIQEIAP